MPIGAPEAIIYGRDSFVAKKLETLLVSRGIMVIWNNETSSRPLYFFDFGGGEGRYAEMAEKRVKVCKVENDQFPISNFQFPKIDNLDWRRVVLHNVYGEGMSSDWFLGKAVELAARNKNLILPKVSEKYRLLSVDDATEAIMRAVIISGTTGKSFEIGGQETDSREVAMALIDLAKMTKMEVQEENLQVPNNNFQLEKDFEQSARALRWKPIVGFREAIKPVVAEFVARIDEEARSQRKEIYAPIAKVERERLKVEVEEAENYQLPITNYQLEIEKEEEKVIEEEVEPEIKEVEEVEEIEKDPPTSRDFGEARREIVVEENEEEEERIVGKKVDWKKVEPRENFQVTKDNFQIKEENPSPLRNYDETKKEIKIEKPRRKRKFPWKKVGLVLGSLILMVGLVMGWLVWGVVNTALNLQKPIGLLEERKIDEAKKMILKYQKRNKSVASFWTGSTLGEVGEISDGVLNIEMRLCVLAESMDRINGAVFDEKVIDFKQTLAQVSSNLMETETEVGVVEARLMSVRNWIPGRWKPQIDKTNNVILKNIDLIRKMRELTNVLPEILGLDGKRRDYLVLLQNEMELRSTGGFIGSYGVISFQEGRLLSFDIKDVYEADGQLRGHVEPPEEIKKYLGEAAWFMRDANWKASFPQASQDLQWFFEKETNRKVDGVIGINLAVVKSILNATGPIYVPDFKEKVDKDNLYEQAEFYSESKFFPGSVQKASFLSGVGKQLFSEISSVKTGQRWMMLTGLIDSLEKNDLQIAINDTKTAQVVSDLGWDGEVFTGKCEVANCYSDYLYVVESNFGVNKANYFLYRSMEQKVDIKESGVQRIVRINYENLAKNTNWPGGDYKNYLRVYLPNDVQVSEVSIMMDGQKQIVPLDQVKMVNMYDKKELGFAVTVPISKKVVVELHYASTFPIMKDKFSYLLYVQRQSGFGDTGMVNLISVPDGFLPVQVSSTASVVGGKLLFNQKLDRDIKMGVEISK